MYFRCSQPAKHHAKAPYLRHQQPSLLRLRLACSVLRTNGHNGCDLRTDCAAVAQKGTIRGRASRIWPVPAAGWKVRCFQNTPAPSQPSQIIHDITPAMQNQRLLWQVHTVSQNKVYTTDWAKVHKWHADNRCNLEIHGGTVTSQMYLRLSIWTSDHSNVKLIRNHTLKQTSHIMSCIWGACFLVKKSKDITHLYNSLRCVPHIHKITCIQFYNFHSKFNLRLSRDA